MPGEKISTVDGVYSVSWDIVRDILFSYHRAANAAASAKISTTSESDWYNPFSWSLPSLENVEVDWDACRKSALQTADKEIARYKRDFPKQPRDIIQEVANKERGITAQRNILQDKLASTHGRNTQSINDSIEAYDNQIAVTKFVRDSSAGLLVLGSTFVTAGAAPGIVALGLGGGSVLTGYGKYQDTGSVGAGVIAGTGTLVIGAFGVGGKALKYTGGQKAVLIVAKGLVETTSGLAAGQDVSDAVISGGASVIAEGSATVLFNLKPVKSLIRKMPMPVKITATGGIRAPGYMTKSLGKEFVSNFGESSTSSMINAGATAAANAAIRKAAAGGSCTYGPIAQATPLPSNLRTQAAFQKIN